jgi:hypothetical protein
MRRVGLKRIDLNGTITKRGRHRLLFHQGSLVVVVHERALGTVTTVLGAGTRLGASKADEPSSQA